MVKDLLELIDFFAEVVNGVDKSRADGKVDLSDAQNFFPAFFLAPNAFTGLSNLGAEWREVRQNDAAMLELTNRFKTKIDLRDDVTEKDVEDLFDGVIRTIVAGARLFKKRDEVAA